MSEKKPLIVLAGPTAVGKTSLSLQLAEAVGGEIISADSMQVYRHMNVGTAKITPAEMRQIRHHLIDILEPWEEFNVVKFQTMAKQAVELIYAAGHIPVIVGGTGFYIQALLYDVDFTAGDEDNSIRMELEMLAKEQGVKHLHQLLAAVDPESAAAIHENNRKRVIRAIEYYRKTGEKISAHNGRERQKESPFDVLYYVINLERQRLYERIELRVEQMIRHGLVAEVQKLLQMGCRKEMVAMQGLGYKEIIGYLEGQCSLDEAVSAIKRDTRHFAKRQLTWFRREKAVRWLQSGNSAELLEQILKEANEKWNL